MRTAVLAGVCLNSEKHRFAGRMEECRALCEAGGIEVKTEVVQNSRSLDPDTAFRAGKVQELAAAASMANADLIIFLQELPSGILSRLKEACGIPVIDRTALILEIFSGRARSAQAKLQVELAQLSYELPSYAVHTETEAHARGGSFRSRGAGETTTAAYRRSVRKRIAAIRRELSEKQKDYHAAEHRRQKSELARCALVGYTNAGKSSLMNAILSYNQTADRSVYADDMLFATLDSAVRNVKYGSRQFLLYDTVGFVSDLPHTLIEAFQSTLDSARDADLLIHVIDACDPLKEEKAMVTLDTLARIGASQIPVLPVYTKTDLPSADVPVEGLGVSSLSGEGIDRLLEAIVNRLYPSEKTMVCRIPYAKIGLVHDLRRTLDIEITEETDQGLEVVVSGPAVRMKPLERYEVKNQT